MTSLASPYGNKTSIAGSWYPTGFHGHSRTGRRNDFMNEFRSRARPSPPVLFMKRAAERPDSHIFSTHDNKEAYLRPEQSCAKRELSEKGTSTRLFDGEFFDLGLGKRKITNSSQSSDNQMFWWFPQKVDFEATGCPQLSSYRTTYNAQQTPTQVYVQTAFSSKANPVKERFTSMYKCTYGANKGMGVINVMNNASLDLSSGAVKSAPSMGRRRAQNNTETVRSCLAWVRESSDKNDKKMNSYTEVSQFKQSEDAAPSKPAVSPQPVPSTPAPPVPTSATTTTAVHNANNCGNNNISMASEYPPKPLVAAPTGGLSSTAYTNEAAIAAATYKQRHASILKSPNNNVNNQVPVRPSTVKCDSIKTMGENSGVQQPAQSSCDVGILRSKSEADLNRPKSVVFSTRLW